jgi:alkanesulfonate monooxygenase SsuD/methylene tetrahydromethanopterin reductase-like flavin-dependent oxidoreductase (luciferase family)
MTRFGYTLMTEQSGPRELVRYASAAEDVGFDFEVSSDHYFPWLDSQGPAGFTDVAIVQVGDERQDEFLAKAAGPLLDKLRAAAPH